MTTPISPGRRRLFRLIAFVLVLVLLETVGWIVVVKAVPGLEKVRRILAGDAAPGQLEKFIPQPYLLYVPSPGFTDRDGQEQHNVQGYRGKAVPFEKPAGKIRIVCLGGSTTYGSGVAHPDETYPAQLEKSLSENLPAGVTGVEIVNGGVPYGTTAEILTHYLFKFHYFRPDLVIVDAGGNDAVPVTSPYYQPDYSHWRQELGSVRKLPAFGRFLVHSRFVSLLLILAVYGDDLRTLPVTRPSNQPPPTRWYPNANLPTGVGPIPDVDLAFRHNLEAVVTEIQHDGAKVLLVPFRAAPVNDYTDDMRLAFARNEAALKEMASEHGLTVAPFPVETITAANWVDGCHLNAAGEIEKARHVATYVRPLVGSQ